MSIVRIDLPDATYQRAWSVANAAERATLLASIGPFAPKRGDVIYQVDVTTYYLVVQSSIVQQISGLAAIPINLGSEVTGVLPTANGGTGVNIATATLVVAYGQIAFPSTQNPSTNANTLDDYKEGVWTPVIGGSSGQSGQAYSTQLGDYCKIGQLVFAGFVVVLSTLGTITGNVELQGLPFVVGSPRCVCSLNWSGFTTPIAILQGGVLTGSSNMFIRYLTTTSVAFNGVLVQADLSNTTAMSGCIMYRAQA